MHDTMLYVLQNSVAATVKVTHRTVTVCRAVTEYSNKF
jgi:hypothetical protein